MAKTDDIVNIALVGGLIALGVAAFPGIKKFFDNLAGAGKGASDVVQGAGDASKGLGAGVATAATGLGQGVSDIATGAGAGAKDALLGVGGAVNTVASETAQNYKAPSDFMQSIFNAGTDLVNSAKDALLSKKKTSQPTVSAPSVLTPAGSVAKPFPVATNIDGGTIMSDGSIVYASFAPQTQARTSSTTSSAKNSVTQKSSSSKNTVSKVETIGGKKFLLTVTSG